MMVPDRWSAFFGVTLAALLAVPVAPPILGAHPPWGIRGFSTAGSLPEVREGHTSSALPDGRVLVVGGYSDGDHLTSSEVWEPASGAFSPAGSLREARTRHTATLLAGGWVLVVGGSQQGRALASAEGWDPADGTFAPLGSMRQGRSWHTATLLADGRVLVVGGVVIGDVGQPFTLLGSAEVWDPASSTFEPTGSLRQPRSGHTASLLPDGRVLVIGGSRRNGAPIDSAELWDPTSGTFESAGSMHQARYAHTATLLPDGRVLVIGGYDSDSDPIATAEAWDPDSGTFESAGSLSRGRADHSATGLPDGGVLLSGGINGDDETIAMAELWDPTTGTFIPAGSLVEPRYWHTATLLIDGRVLLVAGRDMAGGLASSELWQAPQDEPMATPGPTPSPTPQVMLSPTPKPSRQVIERELADSMAWATWEPYRKSPAGTAFDPFEAGALAGVIFDDLDTELHPPVDYIVLFRFPDERRLDRYWQTRATSAASEAPLRSGPCEDGRPGRDDWDHGEYLCYVSDSGTALLRWTDERTDTYGVMNAMAGSGNLKGLFRRWESALDGPAASHEPLLRPVNT